MKSSLHAADNLARRPRGEELKSNRNEAIADVAAYRAIDLIYHSYLTGLILMLSFSGRSAGSSWPASCPA